MFSKKVFCGATSPLFPPGIAAARASAEDRFALLARQADTVACGVEQRRNGEARAHGNAPRPLPCLFSVKRFKQQHQQHQHEGAARSLSPSSGDSLRARWRKQLQAHARARTPQPVELALQRVSTSALGRVAPFLETSAHGMKRSDTRVSRRGVERNHEQHVRETARVT